MVVVFKSMSLLISCLLFLSLIEKKVLESLSRLWLCLFFILVLPGFALCILKLCNKVYKYLGLLCPHWIDLFIIIKLFFLFLVIIFALNSLILAVQLNEKKLTWYYLFPFFNFKPTCVFKVCFLWAAYSLVLLFLNPVWQPLSWSV